jgi:hypothetical protein
VRGRYRVLMKRAALAVVAVALLAGCAGPSGPGPLAAVAAEAQIDARAKGFCDSTYITSSPMVAAYDSTSGEVRDLARVVETRIGWDDYLPREPDNYAAVCIYDISEVGGAVARYSFEARWAGQGDGIGGIGLITLW